MDTKKKKNSNNNSEEIQIRIGFVVYTRILLSAAHRGHIVNSFLPSQYIYYLPSSGNTYCEQTTVILDERRSTRINKLFYFKK